MVSFLQERSFRFKHENTFSSPRFLTAGVPQGSVLSPLLYIAYTNDIPIPQNGVELALFADDTALYTKSRNPQVALTRIQTSITELGNWFRKWRIEVNPEKSSAVYFSHRKRIPHGTRPLRMLGTTVPYQRTVKYLGVTLDSWLTFTPHINQITRTARFYLGRLNGMIGRHSKMSLRNKRTLYKVCIRPVLSYASPVFAHTSQLNIHRLQVIQNLFCRRATNALWTIRNEDLHRDLGLPTIQQHFKKLSESFFQIAEEHSNHLIREAAAYSPPAQTRLSVRRPKNVLSDDPNPLSSKLNRLLEAQ